MNLHIRMTKVIAKLLRLRKVKPKIQNTSMSLRLLHHQKTKVLVIILNSKFRPFLPSQHSKNIKNYRSKIKITTKLKKL